VSSYGFSAADVRRIGEVVRAAEHGRIQKIELGGASAGGATPGVRLLIAKHEGSSWPTGSTAVVTLYNGSVPNSVASAMTMVAYNHYIKFSEGTHCTSRWVALGHNGFAWHPVDSQADCGTCISLIGGVDFRVFPGYSHTATQMLGHDGGGCVKWFNITTCSTAGG
jgi:hypothetical protein